MIHEALTGTTENQAKLQKILSSCISGHKIDKAWITPYTGYVRFKITIASLRGRQRYFRYVPICWAEGGGKHLPTLLWWESWDFSHRVPKHVQWAKDQGIHTANSQLNNCSVGCSDILGLYEIRKCCYFMQSWIERSFLTQKRHKQML